ncbi:TonB-dependent receptor [Catalinimonas alkaloidigena]|uniref:TonB-dependent receptor n=1 Tax=Catalinimonas alkaloidigena TaxID=1075417 RepID=UPI0024070D6A|nr:TonB-dependent receptor [Catalinimonas alkaloidigena]
MASESKTEPKESISIDEMYISFHLEKVTLEEAFAEITKITELKFTYAQGQVNDQKKISLQAQNSPLGEVLKSVSRDYGLEFMRLNNSIIVSKKEGDVGVEVALEASRSLLQVSGKVTAEGDASGLPGVNVLVKGSTLGTVTDVSGNYNVNVPNDNDTLVFSSIGYLSKEVAVNGRSSIDVVLVEDVQSLKEVVVVGYGTQKKVSMTNSVAQISNENIESRPVANIQQSLQGFAPGVTVLDQGGAPGNSTANIRIRGVTTLGDDSKNNPLIIVDGIEQRLSDINPNDIESVSVLKDAASTAIYGSRAANGVILITTKRGEAGKVNITYDGYYALQDAMNRPEHLDLESYLRLENVAHLNAGRTAPYTQEYIQEYVDNAPSPEYPLPFPWWRRDELGILEVAPQQNHTLAVNGGNETIKARMSVRHQSIDGIAPNFSDKINEFRLNTDYTATDKLKFSADLNYRNGESHMPGDGETKIFQYMLHATKFSWPKYETGEYGLGPQVNNPLLFAEITGDQQRLEDYLIGSIKGEYEIFPGLNFSTQYALRYSSTQIKNYSNKYANRDPVTGRFVQKQINSLTEIRRNLKEFTLNSLLRYNKEFGQHGISALLGYSSIDNTYNELQGYRQDFYNNEVRSLNQGSTENRDATGYDAEYGLRSYFARLNYSYANKYLLELNARYDGSSRFSEGNRYSFFPSFSAGWRLSEEAFWDGLEPYINELKLRGSYGATGNQAVGLYSFYETFSAINYSFNGEPVVGYAQQNFANQNLSWETTLQSNVGLDVGVLDDRILFSFDYYNKRTEDILLNLPIPSVVGLGAPPQNAGVVLNKGYEISANYRGGNEFTYDIGLNFSDNQNEVVDLVGTGPYISGASPNPTFIVQKGLPVNAHWGYLTDGFFQSQQEADNYPTLAPNPMPGDVKYVDRNGDGVLNPDDRTFIGRSFPRFNYGMSTNFSYKNFELFTQWQGAAGHKVMLGGAWNHQATYEAFTHAIYADYWTPDNTGARFPRPIKGNTKNRQTSDLTVIDSDYLRLKNVTLSYRVPSSVMNTIFLSNARIYAGVTNVLTISDLNEWDIDPEVPSGRAQYYPQVRTYTLGVNLSF